MRQTGPLPEPFETIDKEEFLDDVTSLIEEEVDAQTGIMGFATKGAFRMAKGIRQNFPREAVETLFPEFARGLSEVVSSRGENQSYEQLFSERAGDVADALLGVTDRKVSGGLVGPLRGLYQKIRGAAKKNVIAAAPRLGRILDVHAR